MSGHSKWHNIQAKKGKADAARGKIFTKLGREILIAVKQGGPDPAGNSKLKDVISKCKANNMPNDTINNAIKKASGATDTSNYEEITYEGYGTNGVAVIVEASTDNRNRTAADVRHVFDKAGGNLGTTGCVSYLFNKKGIIVIDLKSMLKKTTGKNLVDPDSKIKWYTRFVGNNDHYDKSYDKENDILKLGTSSLTHLAHLYDLQEYKGKEITISFKIKAEYQANRCIRSSTNFRIVTI